jgi:O-antigen ligase
MYEVAKVATFQILLFILLLTHTKRSARAVSHFQEVRIYIPIGILILLSLIHLIEYPGPLTWFGNDFRAQGVLTLWALVVFAIVTKDIPLPTNTTLLARISLTLIAATTLLLAHNSAGRPLGTLGEPNALATVALFILPFTLKNIKWKLNNVQLIYILTLVTIIIVQTHSRSALIALALQCFIYTTSKKFRLSHIVLIASILMLASHATILLEKNHLWENRGEIWYTAVMAGLRNPIIGNGFGNTEQTFMMTAIDLVNNTLRYEYVDNSHNIWLEYFVQAGLLGLLSFMWVVISTLKQLVKENNTHLLVAFLGVLTALQYNPPSICALIGLWWIIGKGIATTTATPLHTQQTVEQGARLKSA